MIKIVPGFRKFDKRGNVSVMLAMVFASLILITTVLVSASGKVTSYAYWDGVLQLAGRSILSEYHIALKDTYGIMAFQDYEKSINEKLQFYTAPSLKQDGVGSSRNMISLMKPRTLRIVCDLREYSLTDVEVFEKEVVEYMKYPKLMGKNKEDLPGKSKNSSGVLMNQRIIDELPSRGFENNGINIGQIVSQGFPTWKELFSQGSNMLIVNEYILEYFNYRLGDESRAETFFKNEMEYILYGKFSDIENQDKFMNAFKGMRMLLNSTHIYSDPQKMKEVLSLAETLTPGPQAAITALVIAETWAWAETLNDGKLLLNGEAVALMKNSNQWAINLNAAVSGLLGEEAVKPPFREGYTYKDYLRLFLYFENRETKLVRMMDLIQINIKGGFDQEFCLKDCYVGLNYTVQINGQEHGYVQNY